MKRRQIDPLEEALSNISRKKLYNLISRSPGLHFRELQRRTKYATGMLQYHLDYLQKKHLIRIDKRDNFLRFYSVRKDFAEEDKDLMNLLRNPVTRKIIIPLLESRNPLSINTLANRSSLDRVGLAFHLPKLERAEILKKTTNRGKISFSISTKEKKQKIISILNQYKSSFLDSVVNNFIDTWRQLEAD